MSVFQPSLNVVSAYAWASSVLFGTGLLPLETRHVLVRDDLGHHRLQDFIATGVIGMVMAVDEQVDLPWGSRFQAIEEHLGRIGKLAVDDQHGIRRHQPAHRPTARRERPDVPAQRRENGNRWRLGRRRRRLLPQQPSWHEGAGCHCQRRPDDELTSIGVHTERSLLHVGSPIRGGCLLADRRIGISITVSTCDKPDQKRPFLRRARRAAA